MSGENSSNNNSSDTTDLSRVEFDYDKMNSSSKYESNNKKALMFSGDATWFEWWKDSIYHYINDIDDELCDLVKEGVHINGI